MRSPQLDPATQLPMTKRLIVTLVLDVAVGSAENLVRNAITDAVTDVLASGERIVRTDVEAW